MPAASPEPLTRDRVVAAAVGLADQGGLAGVSMRKVGDELGVEAMSLYHHVANKSALLDAMVDAVYAEFTHPVPGRPWRAEVRAQCESAREVLSRHSWATPLLGSRTSPGPATLAYLDAVLGTLRTAGFSLALTAHAVALLDTYTYGFALQEAALPFASGEGAADIAEGVLGDLAPDAFPHLTEIAVDHVMAPDYRFLDEFAWGLDLLLDALEARFHAEQP